MTDEVREKLEELLADLQADADLCTDRAQYIRAIQRVITLQSVIHYPHGKASKAEDG